MIKFLYTNFNNLHRKIMKLFFYHYFVVLYYRYEKYEKKINVKTEIYKGKVYESSEYMFLVYNNIFRSEVSL